MLLSLSSRLSSSISGEVPIENDLYNVRFRYRQSMQEASLRIKDSKFRIHFNMPQHSVTPGQSLVLYKGDECVGGGVISTNSKK